MQWIDSCFNRSSEIVIQSQSAGTTAHIGKLTLRQGHLIRTTAVVGTPALPVKKDILGWKVYTHSQSRGAGKYANMSGAIVSLNYLSFEEGQIRIMISHSHL